MRIYLIGGQLYSHLQGVLYSVIGKISKILSLLLFADSIYVLHELTAEKARIYDIFFFFTPGEPY